MPANTDSYISFPAMTDTSRETRRKRWEPFVVPVISLGLLAGLQALQGVWSSSTFRDVDMLSQVFPKAPKVDSVKLAAALADTAEMLARIDTVKAQSERVAKVLKDSSGIVSIENPEQLSRVFAALKQGKGARIAWFGDSFIEGDILVQDVREVLQKVFGGKGVGLVPATSITAQFRQSVHHTFSKDWEEVSILSRRSPTPLGITGHVFYPVASLDSNEASWVDLRAAARSGSTSFDRVRVLYGSSRDTAASVSCWSVRKPLVAGPGLHETQFHATGAKAARIRLINILTAVRWKEAAIFSLDFSLLPSQYLSRWFITALFNPEYEISYGFVFSRIFGPGKRNARGSPF